MSNFYKGLKNELDAEYDRQLKSLQDFYDKKAVELNYDFDRRYEALRDACPHDSERNVNWYDSQTSQNHFDYYCDDCGKYLRTV